MIASVVMLAVLVTAISSVTTTRTALDEQYLNTLAREAAESGANVARTCVDAIRSVVDGSITWSGTLTNMTDCHGVTRPECPTDPDKCHVVNTPNLQTGYEVTAIVSDSVVTFKATGIVQQLRTSNGSVWRQVSDEIQLEVAYDIYNLSNGNDTPCAITDGRLYCWGRNDYGQTGNGNRISPQTTPQQVTAGGLGSKRVTAVANGIHHTCAIADNNVYCWGDNAYAQFGNGAPSAMNDEPILVPTLAARGTTGSTTASAGLTGRASKVITGISARDHTCITMSGEVWCWGYNKKSQAGPVFNSTTVVEARTSQGNGETMEAVGTIIPINVAPVRVGPALTGATNIYAVNGGTACAVFSQRNYCWGTNGNYSWGNGTTTTSSLTSVPVQTGVAANMLTSVIESVSNYGRTCLLNSGRVYCWGAHGGYRIDASVTASPTAPLLLTLPSVSGNNFTRIAMSDWTTCVLATDGKIWCWGYNDVGQLGNGTVSGPAFPGSTTLKPVAAAAATRVGGVFLTQKAINITATNNSFCAMTEVGAVYCWGDNTFGQIGDGTSIHRATPVRVQTPIGQVLYF